MLVLLVRSQYALPKPATELLMGMHALDAVMHATKEAGALDYKTGSGWASSLLYWALGFTELGMLALSALQGIYCRSLMNCLLCLYSRQNCLHYCDRHQLNLTELVCTKSALTKQVD
jgi:hypothetical protein